MSQSVWEYDDEAPAKPQSARYRQTWGRVGQHKEQLGDGAQSPTSGNSHIPRKMATSFDSRGFKSRPINFSLPISTTAASDLAQRSMNLDGLVSHTTSSAEHPAYRFGFTNSSATTLPVGNEDEKNKLAQAFNQARVFKNISSDVVSFQADTGVSLDDLESRHPPSLIHPGPSDHLTVMSKSQSTVTSDQLSDLLRTWISAMETETKSDQERTAKQERLDKRRQFLQGVTQPQLNTPKNTQMTCNSKETLERHNLRLQKQVKRLQAQTVRLQKTIRTRGLLDGPAAIQYADQVSSQHLLATPRSLLLRSLVQSQEPCQSWLREEASDDVMLRTMDSPLNTDEIRCIEEVMERLSYLVKDASEIGLQTCCICKKVKFDRVLKPGESPNSASQRYLHELEQQCGHLGVKIEPDFQDTFRFTCCQSKVCDTCFGGSVLQDLQNGWWHNIYNSSNAWLRCPSCRATLPEEVSYRAEFSRLMLALGIKEWDIPLDDLDRGNQIRAFLRTMSPRPTLEALERSMSLHRQLLRHSRISSFSDPQRRNVAVEVAILPIDSADGDRTLDAPIFTHLFAPKMNRECVVCTEGYQEFDRGDARIWAKATAGFDGDWRWKILHFPAQEVVPDCHHELDICRTCLATHIKTQVEAQGRSCIDNISCPHPDCAHLFTHEEVRRLASPETFAEYDSTSALKSMCALPNFRWCLREGCNSGGLYEVMDMGTGPSHDLFMTQKIQCSDCSLFMCYNHQVPWHAGQTCAEYDAQKKHGDPQYQKTMQWLGQNTKACPGKNCGVAVEKGAGCFHMTCRVCHHEFCWECLAAWKNNIVVRDAFNQKGHKEGCYFRSQGARAPTQVFGQQLSIALGRRG